MSKIKKILIANRGEIAVRIAATAAVLGIRSVAIYAEDDAQALHRDRCDEAVALKGFGATAYLDAQQVVAVAKETSCDAIHPGYGFLSENAAFARQCAESGIKFIGPSADALDVFANKATARALAQRCGVTVLEGSGGEVSLDEARAFFDALGDGAAIMIKAVSGGGGRGMRVVRRVDEIEAAYTACQVEAESAFGYGAVLVERFMPRARHIEVQIIADAFGSVAHLGERDCSLQRRNQKLVEMAPCPGMPAGLRERIAGAAVSIAAAARYSNLGTFEFLVDAEALQAGREDAFFAFLEANPRLQVEHTVTEEVTGVDLVAAQIQIADGASLRSLGLARGAAMEGRFAIQARIYAEDVDAAGQARPVRGTLTAYETPSGRGIRVDGCGYAGYVINPRYDALLAKVIALGATSDAGLAKLARALRECRIEGVQTNAAFLAALVAHEDVRSGNFDTRFVDEHMHALQAAGQTIIAGRRAAATAPIDSPARVVADQTLAPQDGQCIVGAPLPGIVAEISVSTGDAVVRGQTLALIESMKMVHAVTAPIDGRITAVRFTLGDLLDEGDALVVLEAMEGAIGADTAQHAEEDPDVLRADLAQVLERRRLGQDEARPAAVAKRHALGLRTARGNVAALCDSGSFVEYGALALAAQSRRRTTEDLAQNTTGDGIIAGFGRVNGDLFNDEASQCAILAYDYTVLAGTQGHNTHRKKDRILELAARRRTPVVLLSEGGGGRPGDIDVLAVTGLDVASFQLLAGLSGLVPLVGVNAGRCFAGNAALLGCCDVIIATKASSIGMGGPALIEAAGLGAHKPEDVGPVSVQAPNGVIDIVVEDEAEAIATAKQYLAFFQGTTTAWSAADQRRLRTLLPEDRVRAYDMRRIVETLADEGSVLELRRAYGAGVITTLARVEGRPFGIIANNPSHLGGAIDGPAADKASRFMQLCDAHDLPILSLCDTPGFMVGPQSEKSAVVRRFARMFVTAAGMTTPMMSIVLRKAYGLGAMSMLAGHGRTPHFLVSWPSGEFGGMGLEGAIQLGMRKELEAIDNAAEREAYYRKQVAAAYAWGRALNAAAHFEVDDVIDPQESRRWISAALAAFPPPARRAEKKRRHIDTW